MQKYYALITRFLNSYKANKLEANKSEWSSSDN